MSLTQRKANITSLYCASSDTFLLVSTLTRVTLSDDNQDSVVLKFAPTVFVSEGLYYWLLLARSGMFGHSLTCPIQLYSPLYQLRIVDLYLKAGH